MHNTHVPRLFGHEIWLGYREDEEPSRSKWFQAFKSGNALWLRLFRYEMVISEARP